MGSTPVLHSVLNVKVLVGAFNQVGVFSVIVNTDCETDGSFYSTSAIYKPEFSRFPAKKGHETGDWLTYSLFSPSVILPICMCQAWARHYG